MATLIITVCLSGMLDCMVATLNVGNFVECRLKEPIERELLVRTIEYSGVTVEYWEVRCEKL